MRWILRLVEVRTDARSRSMDLMELARSDSISDIAELGLTLTEAKQLLAKLQQAVAEAQAYRHAMLQPNCRFVAGHVAIRTGACIGSERCLAA